MNRPNRYLHDWAYAALIGVLAAVLLLATPAFAQTPQALDAAALKKVGEANLAAANAGELAAAIGAISDASACDKVESSQRGMCVVMAKSYGMLAYVIGKQSETVTQVIEAAPAQAHAAQEPPPRKEWWERAWDWGVAATKGVFDVGLSLGTQYYTTKLGMRQSDNATAQHAATVGGFVAMNNGTVRVAQTGFRTQARTARDAFAMGTAIGTKPAPPTTQITVTGDGNNVGGRDVSTTTTTITTTDTVTCPLTTSTTGGAGGTSGTVAPNAGGSGSAAAAPNTVTAATNCATRTK